MLWSSTSGISSTTVSGPIDMLPLLSIKSFQFSQPIQLMLELLLGLVVMLMLMLRVVLLLILVVLLVMLLVMGLLLLVLVALVLELRGDHTAHGRKALLHQSEKRGLGKRPIQKARTVAHPCCAWLLFCLAKACMHKPMKVHDLSKKNASPSLVTRSTLTKCRISDSFETFSIIASTLKPADHPRKVHWDAGALAAATCFLHFCCQSWHHGFPNSRTACCLEVGASKISRSLLGHWNTSAGSQGEAAGIDRINFATVKVPLYAPSRWPATSRGWPHRCLVHAHLQSKIHR